jgi:hypothetical protein
MDRQTKQISLAFELHDYAFGDGIQNKPICLAMSEKLLAR